MRPISGLTAHKPNRIIRGCLCQPAKSSGRYTLYAGAFDHLPALQLLNNESCLKNTYSLSF